MNRITLAHPPSFDTVRATPFGAAVCFEDRLLKPWPELMRITQLAREGSPPPGLRLPQAELSRKSNQVALAQIRRFESDMPSQAVGSLWAVRNGK